MSIRKGSRTIASSVPVTEWGSVDGTLADQVDLKSALDSKAPNYSPTFTGTPIAPTAPVNTSNNQVATTKFVQDALLNAEANLPEQEGNAGKFLSTNGSIPSWESITGLPSQTSQSGKFLTTNGTAASWANAVTTDTAQTITGDKTIENTNVTSSTVDGVSLTIKSDNQHLGTNPSSNHISSINFTDDSNATVAKFSSIQTSDGWSGFLAGAGSDPTNPHNNMLMIASGNNKLLLIPPTTSHSSCAIRRDFFDTEFGKTVKNTGDETIAGVKTFTSWVKYNTESTNTAGYNAPAFWIKDDNLDTTTNPSYMKEYYVCARDNADRYMGWTTYRYNTDGSSQTLINARTRDTDNTEDISASISIKVNRDGTAVTSAPTPSSVTDNTTKIATTAWVINVLQALYPVGSLYMGTQNSCPLSAFFGTWELVSAGNALWTGNGTSGTGTTTNANYANAAANTTIAAGLPSITTSSNGAHGHRVYIWDANNTNYDATTWDNNGTTKSTSTNGGRVKSGNIEWLTSSFKTAGNEIFSGCGDKIGNTNSTGAHTHTISWGASTNTVQPPAYVVNVWRRTA